MKKITKREIKKYYKKSVPIIESITGIFLGLIFEIGMPAAALLVGIVAVLKFGAVGVLVLLLVFPLVLGIGLLLFRGIIISSLKRLFLTRTNNYRIVLAKCIGVKVGTIDTETGEAATMRYTFEADDGKISATDMRIDQGHDAYLVIAGREVVAAFDAEEYYADKYVTFLNSPKRRKK